MTTIIPLFKRDSDSQPRVRDLWGNADSAPNERNGPLAAGDVVASGESVNRCRLQGSDLSLTCLSS
jgi:hypothetical protein